MPRTPRNKAPAESATPRDYLSKEQFGRRLKKLMNAREWNNSEMARRAGVGRDMVGTYVMGKAYPSEKTLEAIAQAFGMTPGELLPNVIIDKVADDPDGVEMKLGRDPTTAVLRVNRLVKATTAMKIIELLRKETPDAPDGD